MNVQPCYCTNLHFYCSKFPNKRFKLTEESNYEDELNYDDLPDLISPIVVSPSKLRAGSKLISEVLKDVNAGIAPSLFPRIREDD